MILKYKNIIRSANIKYEGVIVSIGDGIVKASGFIKVLLRSYISLLVRE
jgi:hypothetical protein